MMGLEEKIDHEYQIYYLDETCKSRASIYAHSAEIEQMKRLKEELYRLADRVDGPTEEILCRQENLLESAYRFLDDYRKRDGADDSLEEIVKRWVSFLVGQKGV